MTTWLTANLPGEPPRAHAVDDTLLESVFLRGNPPGPVELRVPSKTDARCQTCDWLTRPEVREIAEDRSR